MAGIFGVFRTREPAFACSTYYLMLLCCLGGGRAPPALATPVIASLDFSSVVIGNNPSIINDIAPTESSPSDGAGGDDNGRSEDVRKYSDNVRNASHFAQIIDGNCDDSSLCLRIPWYLSFSSTAARWAYERRGAPDVLGKIYAVSLDALGTKDSGLVSATALEERAGPGAAGSGANGRNAKSAEKRSPAVQSSVTVVQWAVLIGEVYRSSPNGIIAVRVLTDPAERGDARPMRGLPGADQALDANSSLGPAVDVVSEGVRRDGYLTRVLKSFVHFLRSIRDAVGV